MPKEHYKEASQSSEAIAARKSWRCRKAGVKRYFMALIAFVALSSTTSLGEGEAKNAITVFRGFPFSAWTSDGGRPEGKPLSAEKAREARCEIVQKNGQFIWASRGNLPLIMVESPGAYIVFAEPGGAGFVKILKRGSETAREKFSYDYLEVVHSELTPISYWGKRDPSSRK